MTRALIIAAALAATPAYADTIPPVSYRIEASAASVASYRIPAEATRRAAMRWEAAYLTLSAIDTVQTVRCFKRDHGCVELNPFWPGKPSVERIIIGKVVGGAFHYAAVRYIADRNPKMALRIAQISVGVQGAGVAFNLRSDF